MEDNAPGAWRGPPFLLCLLALLAAGIAFGIAGEQQLSFTAFVGAVVLSGIRALFQEPPQ